MSSLLDLVASALSLWAISLALSFPFLTRHDVCYRSGLDRLNFIWLINGKFDQWTPMKNTWFTNDTLGPRNWEHNDCHRGLWSYSRKLWFSFVGASQTPLLTYKSCCWMGQKRSHYASLWWMCLHLSDECVSWLLVNQAQCGHRSKESLSAFPMERLGWWTSGILSHLSVDGCASQALFPWRGKMQPLTSLIFSTSLYWSRTQTRVTRKGS